MKMMVFTRNAKACKSLSIIMILMLVCNIQFWVAKAEVPSNWRVARETYFSRNYDYSADPADYVARIAEAQYRDRTNSELGQHYPGDWCSAFTADCAYLAGQEEAVPWAMNAGTFGNQLSNAGGVETNSPRRGDIVIWYCRNTSYHGGVYRLHVGIMIDETTCICGNNLNRFTAETAKIKCLSCGSTGYPRYFRPKYKGSVIPQPIIESHLGDHVLGRNGTYYVNNGNEVSELQAALNQIGYSLDVDGEYGPATEAAVRDFQANCGLESDGIFGKLSYAALIDRLNARQKPTNAWINVSKSNVESGESFVVHWGADNASVYKLCVRGDNYDNTFDYGNNTSHEFVIRTEYRTTVQFYVIASNDYGSVDSSTVSVSVTVSGSLMTTGYDRVLPDGDYVIAAAGASNKSEFYYLDIEGTDQPAANETNVSLCGPSSRDLPSYEVWTITYNSSDKFYTIKQKGTNMALDVYKGHKSQGTNVEVYTSTINNEAQKWAISHNGNNGYRVQAQCSGQSLDVYGGILTNGANVNMWSDNESNAQSWLFIPYIPSKTLADGNYVLLSALDNSLTMDISNNNVDVWKDTYSPKNNVFEVKSLSNGYYTLKHVKTGKMLTAVDNGNTYGGNIEIADGSSGINVQWSITKHGDNGGYVLRSRMNGYTIDVKDGQATSGTNVQQWPYNGTKAQTWKFVQAEHSVTYNANGGINAPSGQTKYYKTTLYLSGAVPTRDNYVFIGWAETSDAQEANYQSGDGYALDADLTLYAVWQKATVNVTGITLDSKRIETGKNQTVTLKATVLPSDASNTGVTWSSSNEIVATVDNLGVVTTKSNGTAIITATTEDGAYEASCTVVVTTPISALNLSKESINMNKGDVAYIVVMITPGDASNQTINWSNSNPDVAVVGRIVESITGSGTAASKRTYEITAKGNGKTTITATTVDGCYSASCLLTVSTSVGGISLNKNNLRIKKGEVEQLTATVTPNDASDKTVTWSSNNSSVVIVSGTGTVTAKGLGKATITARSVDGGYTAICQVEVISAGMSTPDFVLPVALKEIEAGAFEGINASVIECPKGLTSIGARAFANSPRLREIYIPDSVTFISKTAFDGDQEVTIYGKPDSTAELYANAYGYDFVEVN